MFKVLILQAMNGLGDEATEYFMRDYGASIWVRSARQSE
jgi:hypothetical protein